MLVFARRLSRYSLASPHDEYSLLSHTPDDGGQDLKAWWPGISVVCLGEPFLSRQLVRTEPLSRLTFILSLPYIAELTWAGSFDPVTSLVPHHRPDWLSPAGRVSIELALEGCID